ncbi:hypothetical protein M011DRAFT_483364 [Sporormia fimetaria CBS 119925]|uniref:Uncharacterized protein n=1 Tax=Sporormia fimetaria CBS 119925 TaxID=1340428 RepID=A0A6A6VNW8_9PLEO|nr:hypothetical protein M011DRAFT_483364 [Sporormia fimetaria CBS 119925]
MASERQALQYTPYSPDHLHESNTPLPTSASIERGREKETTPTTVSTPDSPNPYKRTPAFYRALFITTIYISTTIILCLTILHFATPITIPFPFAPVLNYYIPPEERVFGVDMQQECENLDEGYGADGRFVDECVGKLRLIRGTFAGVVVGVVLLQLWSVRVIWRAWVRRWREQWLGREEEGVGLGGGDGDVDGDGDVGEAKV